MASLASFVPKHLGSSLYCASVGLYCGWVGKQNPYAEALQLEK